MKLTRRPRLPRDLRRVQAALSKLDRNAARPPDLANVHTYIRLLVESMVPNRTDDEIVAAVDAYVDGRLVEWINDARRRHDAVVSELDRLRVPVSSALFRSRTLDHDEERQLEDFDGAVEHSIERVIDPDSPYYDPLPQRRLTKD